MKFWGTVSFLAILVMILLGYSIKQQVTSDGPLTEAVTIDIAKGAASQQVARYLEQKGIIANS